MIKTKMGTASVIRDVLNKTPVQKKFAEIPVGTYFVVAVKDEDKIDEQIYIKVDYQERAVSLNNGDTLYFRDSEVICPVEVVVVYEYNLEERKEGEES